MLVYSLFVCCCQWVYGCYAESVSWTTLLVLAFVFVLLVIVLVIVLVLVLVLLVVVVVVKLGSSIAPRAFVSGPPV